jgi:hypothetical protein
MDLGSGIRKKTYSGSRIPDPGVKKAPDPGSGSATLSKWLLFMEDELRYFVPFCGVFFKCNDQLIDWMPRVCK